MEILESVFPRSPFFYDVESEDNPLEEKAINRVSINRLGRLSTHFLN